jgi:ornithine carbamoyltransferase
MSVRHFLEITDLSADELHRVLDLSEDPDFGTPLEGRTLALLFEKPSARTRASMETAITDLGGHPITMRNEEVGIDVRETAEDLGRLLSGYCAAIALRTNDHSKLERLAAAASVPVLNLLTDLNHPIQTLADLLTIRAEFGTIEDLTVAWVGDANNVARSLALGCKLAGSRFRFASPSGYRFSDRSAADLAAAGCATLCCETPQEAVSGADVVVTDAWYSMGQEAERIERQRIFEPYRVDEELLAMAAPHAIFMHCLPAHRGDEATDGVLDGPQSRIWPEAHNRRHSARGLLRFLLETS